MIAYYILLSLINLSFVITIIFENQVDLISKNVLLESEKQLSQLIGSMKNFSAEMKKGNLFNIKDDREALSQFVKSIHLHYKDFIIFSDKNSVIYNSSPGRSLPEAYKEDLLRSMTTMAFTGKEYYIRVDDQSKVINFYIPLGEFLSGDHILLVRKDINTVSDSLIDLYKQVIYVIFVVLFFHLLFAVILYKSIIHPVRILGEAAEKLSKGDLTSRVELTGKTDEFTSLSLIFNKMAESIEKNIKSFSNEIDTVKNIKNILGKTEIRDELTGLLSEYYIYERIDEELTQSKLKQRDMAFIIINPDNFNKINGMYGTQTGDIMLMEVARKITGCCSIGDVVARFGGEEFAVLSTETSRDAVTDLAEKIRLSISKSDIVTPDGKFSITVSLGISYISSSGLISVENRDDVIAPARQALMKAKSSGKNRVEFNS
jgi:diguanylate cyclase (GGDEF)-like protein